MNVETFNLMYFLAPPEVFAEYGITSGSFTKLESGKVFGHMHLCGVMAVVANGDSRVVPYTSEALISYIEYVDGYWANTVE